MNLQLAWEENNRLEVTCSGKLGWDTQDELFKKVKEAVADRQQPKVLIDLEAVELITSAGLGTLLQVRKLINERDGRLVLASASPWTTQLFRTVGLDRHVPMADTLDEARAMLGGDNAADAEPENGTAGQPE